MQTRIAVITLLLSAGVIGFGSAGCGGPDTEQSSQALGIILSNIDMAADDEGPICQDTGMPTFLVHTPVGVNQIQIRKAIVAAVAAVATMVAAH